MRIITPYGKATISQQIYRHFHPRKGWYNVGIPLDGLDTHEEEM